MDADWLEKYKGEVDFAMNEFDRFFRELTRFVDANPEYQLWVCSSMGQKATRAEMVKTETYCPDLAKFVSAMGLKEDEWEKKSAMHPQYNLTVIPEKIEEFRDSLKQLSISGTPLDFRQKEGGFFSIDLGHKNLENAYVAFKGKDMAMEDVGLSNEPIDDETGSTAYHIKEGSLMVYDPQHRRPKPRQAGISTCAIVPSIMENFELKVPGYMSEERITF